ncbi:hypothetical protein F3C99_08990 [Vitellibacter sp. q18]|jgi:hypothetical protein|nr:hypothetical protein [Aequorivita lutea]
MSEDDSNFNYRKRYNEIKSMPIFMKAREIILLAHHLTETIIRTDIPDQDEIDKEILEEIAETFMENALAIPSQIVGAEILGYYAVMMEKAVLIRNNASSLYTDLQEFKSLGFKQTEYLDLLRNEIEAFRHLFAQWVTTFNPNKFTIDPWGLFNPPGVDYKDADLNSNNFFEQEEIINGFLEGSDEEELGPWFGDDLDDEDDDDEFDDDLF